MTARYLIGIDDTDHGESIGTGALARELSLFLERELGATSHGVTRHQLLVHPDVPYTSHNSAACIGLGCDADPERVEDVCTSLLRSLFHEGADPGLCISSPAGRDDEWESFGRAAQSRVLEKDDATALAARLPVRLRELGGNGQGVIGALAACGLRLGGRDGRFISLRGIRSVPTSTTVARILAQTGVQRVEDESGAAVDPSAVVDTRDWVRPDLREDRIVLVLTQDENGYHVDRSRRKGKS